MFGNGLRPQIWKSFVTRFGIKQIAEFYGSTEGNSQISKLALHMKSMHSFRAHMQYFFPASLQSMSKIARGPLDSFPCSSPESSRSDWFKWKKKPEKSCGTRMVFAFRANQVKLFKSAYLSVTKIFTGELLVQRKLVVCGFYIFFAFNSRGCY